MRGVSSSVPKATTQQYTIFKKEKRKASHALRRRKTPATNKPAHDPNSGAGACVSVGTTLEAAAVVVPAVDVVTAVSTVAAVCVPVTGVAIPAVFHLA